jgi:hypothetical protein
MNKSYRIHKEHSRDICNIGHKAQNIEKKEKKTENLNDEQHRHHHKPGLERTSIIKGFWCNE